MGRLTNWFAAMLDIPSTVKLTTEQEEQEYLKRVEEARERYTQTDRHRLECLLEDYHKNQK